MNEQNVSLERSLADLDWEGVGIPTVLANVFWVFLLLGLSNTEIMRRAISGDILDFHARVLATLPNRGGQPGGQGWRTGLAVSGRRGLAIF